MAQPGVCFGDSGSTAGSDGRLGLAWYPYMVADLDNGEVPDHDWYTGMTGAMEIAVP